VNYFDIEKNLEVALSDGSQIKIVSFSVDEAVEQQLRLTVQRILERYERAHLSDAIFACALELATNATKANMKHVFFTELGLDIAIPAEYEEGMARFKKTALTREWLESYADKAQKMDLRVQMVFTHTVDGLRIEIINNRQILPQDEDRIREKFNRAMQYDSLHQYYLDNSDQTEGEGLGFALSILLLKGENLDASLFRIGREDRGTIARIEVPFTENFVSVRPKKPPTR